jgi:hypothetical protein
MSVNQYFFFIDAEILHTHHHPHCVHITDTRNLVEFNVSRPYYFIHRLDLVNKLKFRQRSVVSRSDNNYYETLNFTDVII